MTTAIGSLRAALEEGGGRKEGQGIQILRVTPGMGVPPVSPVRISGARSLSSSNNSPPLPNVFTLCPLDLQISFRPTPRSSHNGLPPHPVGRCCPHRGQGPRGQGQQVHGLAAREQQVSVLMSVHERGQRPMRTARGRAGLGKGRLLRFARAQPSSGDRSTSPPTPERASRSRPLAPNSLRWGRASRNAANGRGAEARRGPGRPREGPITACSVRSSSS